MNHSDNPVKHYSVVHEMSGRRYEIDAKDYDLIANKFKKIFETPELLTESGHIPEKLFVEVMESALKEIADKEKAAVKTFEDFSE